MDTWSLTKKANHTVEKNKASTNGACLTGSLPVEECKLIHIYHHAQSYIQVDQGPQHETRYTEFNRRESGK